MGYGAAGKCYATAAEALPAFATQYPVPALDGFVVLNSSSVTAVGVVTYSLTWRPWGGGNEHTRTGTYQMPSCTEDVTPAFDATAAGGVFAFFFLGVAGTWYLAQNLGLILEAVKKW